MSGTRAASVLVGAFGSLAITGILFACGSRTGLLVPEYVYEEPDGSIVPLEDAGVDVGQPIPDALPGLDVQPLRDARQALCADAADTLIYVVTEANALLRFDPASSTFSVIGNLVCPDPYNRSPFSMAVDRTGVAYVLYAQYDDGTLPPPPGNLFRVSLDTAACAPTNFQGGQSGFDGFGMGFSADAVGLGETLYVASDDQPSGRLGAIDPTSLALTPVGTFNPAVVGAELTGTGDGRLFAFFASNGSTTPGSVVAQIDKTTANVIGEAQLPSVTQGGGWAFAFWGGDFYLFTAANQASSVVTRYDPATGVLTDVASYPEIIVGAGVSTCAPVQ